MHTRKQKITFYKLLATHDKDDDVVCNSFKQKDPKRSEMASVCLKLALVDADRRGKQQADISASLEHRLVHYRDLMHQQ